jgi:hypothetical protein
VNQKALEFHVRFFRRDVLGVSSIFRRHMEHKYLAPLICTTGATHDERK